MCIFLVFYFPIYGSFFNFDFGFDLNLEIVWNKETLGNRNINFTLLHE